MYVYHDDTRYYYERYTKTYKPWIKCYVITQFFPKLSLKKGNWKNKKTKIRC